MRAFSFYLFFMIYLLPQTSNAMTVSEYQQRQTQETPTEAFSKHLNEIVTTIVIYTKVLRAQQLDPLFCPAAGTSMNVDDIHRIIEREIQKGVKSEELIQVILLHGFMNTFPCSKK